MVKSEGNVTAITLEVPVIEADTVSVAVMVWFPPVFKVAESVPVPLVKVEFPGKTAVPSLLVKCTVPAYAAALLNASSAATVNEKAEPAEADAAAETIKCVAAAALTAVLEVPVIDGVTVSVAVTVWFPAVFKVAEKLSTPLVKMEFAGNTAATSLLVKCTVPA
jgi:hypothetical protein